MKGPRRGPRWAVIPLLLVTAAGCCSREIRVGEPRTALAAPAGEAPISIGGGEAPLLDTDHHFVFGAVSVQGPWPPGDHEMVAAGADETGRRSRGACPSVQIV